MSTWRESLDNTEEEKELLEFLEKHSEHKKVALVLEMILERNSARDLLSKNRQLELNVLLLQETLQQIVHPSRLRDLSKLASNPPQNGAVYDIQVIANRALKYVQAPLILRKLIDLIIEMDAGGWWGHPNFTLQIKDTLKEYRESWR